MRRNLPQQFTLWAWVALMLWTVSFPGQMVVAQPAGRNLQSADRRVPLINITDLYHPYQDVGDNFDLIMGYALPELDLKAVILDVTDAFRKPVADHPTLWPDPRGPREAGIIPVMQLNAIFNRNVPFAVGPFSAMHSPEDQMREVPAFQQKGVELLLETLRQSPEPVQILSFGSARVLAVAYNREPELLRRKVKQIHLSAGTASPDYALGKDQGANKIPGGEWNVALDVHAFRRLLQSDLPIALYPCATQDGAFALGPNNTYWQLPNLAFIGQMHPQLRRYLDFAFGKSLRHDFLRALEVDGPTDTTAVAAYKKPHHVWETALWMSVAERQLVRRADGRYHLLPQRETLPGDKVLANQLKPCLLQVREDGRFVFAFTQKPSNILLYDRGDYALNEQALREALPKLYVSLTP
jgi:hypothetical protein